MRWLGLRALSQKRNADNTEPIRFAPFESLKEAAENRKQKQKGTASGIGTARSTEPH